MSTLTARRPARMPPPDPGSDPVALVAPPRQNESAPMSGSLGMILVPAASGVGAVLLAVTHQDRPLMAAAGLLVLAASIAVGLAMVIGSRTGVRRQPGSNGSGIWTISSRHDRSPARAPTCNEAVPPWPIRHPRRLSAWLGRNRAGGNVG